MALNALVDSFFPQSEKGLIHLHNYM